MVPPNCRGRSWDADRSSCLALPGDRVAVILLYPAVHGMIVDDLTVPDVPAASAGELIDELCRRLLPRRHGGDARGEAAYPGTSVRSHHS